VLVSAAFVSPWIALVRVPVKRAWAGGSDPAWILRLGHITRAWPPILAWRPRLLARNITGIGWQPLTLTASSFGWIHVVLIRQPVGY